MAVPAGGPGTWFQTSAGRSLTGWLCSLSLGSSLLFSPLGGIPASSKEGGKGSEPQRRRFLDSSSAWVSLPCQAQPVKRSRRIRRCLRHSDYTVPAPRRCAPAEPAGRSLRRRSARCHDAPRARAVRAVAVRHALRLPERPPAQPGARCLPGPLPLPGGRHHAVRGLFRAGTLCCAQGPGPPDGLPVSTGRLPLLAAGLRLLASVWATCLVGAEAWAPGSLPFQWTGCQGQTERQTRVAGLPHLGAQAQ